MIQVVASRPQARLHSCDDHPPSPVASEWNQHCTGMASSKPEGLSWSGALGELGGAVNPYQPGRGLREHGKLPWCGLGQSLGHQKFWCILVWVIFRWALLQSCYSKLINLSCAPQFQHCAGQVPPCLCGSDAFGHISSCCRFRGPDLHEQYVEVRQRNIRDPVCIWQNNCNIRQLSRCCLDTYR